MLVSKKIKWRNDHQYNITYLIETFQESSFDFSTSKLNKVTQLTGFSDPVYAEAYVHVNQVLSWPVSITTFMNGQYENETSYMVAF